MNVLSLIADLFPRVPGEGEGVLTQNGTRSYDFIKMAS